MRNFKLKKLSLLSIFAFLVLFISSCTKEEPDVTPVAVNYNNGVFVINEGSFGNGTGTLSYIARDGSSESHKIYQKANDNTNLGNVAQSMHLIGDLAYIVVNNASRIVIANSLSMKHINSIEGVDQPRYLINDGEKFYVSCWDNTVKAYNLETNELVQSYSTGGGPEKLSWVNDEIWVLNQGGFSVDSTVSIINPQTGLTETLNIYPRPTGIQMDKDGMVWIMCSGRLDYHQGGSSAPHLLCINPLDRTVVKNVIFPWTQEHPLNLEINSDGNELYYLYPGGISRFGIYDEFPLPEPFISYSGSIYGLGYDPVENMLYVSDALDYVQNGVVIKYNAELGTLELSFTAGIIPSGFCFTSGK